VGGVVVRSASSFSAIFSNIGLLILLVMFSS
jgi:hypothetical protein